jgi:uncharacterized membrane protein
MPEYTPIPSKAALFGHPIHPMLIPFPIAFLIGALAADLAWWGTRAPFWAEAAFWLIAAGLVMGALAALAGLTDFIARPQVRRHSVAALHFAGNAIVLVLAAINLALRWKQPATPILPWGLVISAATTALLGITGWLGGELAYRYGIGQIEAPSVRDYRPVEPGPGSGVNDSQPKQPPRRYTG